MQAAKGDVLSLFVACLALYRQSIPLNTRCQASLDELFMFMTDTYLEHSQPGELVSLARRVLVCLRESKCCRVGQSRSCPARLYFAVFRKVVDVMHRDL